MKIFWTLSVIVFALTACQWGGIEKQKPAINIDTLAYTYQLVKQRADDCGNKPDSGCTVAAIKYPVFKNEPILNDTITNKLIGLFGSDKKDRTLEAYCTSFLKSYADFKNEKDARKGVFFTLSAYSTLIRQDSSLTTLEVGGYDYNGGAHGNTIINFINWNTKSKKSIQLSDILTGGYEKQLTSLAEIIFRKNENLDANASLKDNYFFKGGKFALNNNYSITPEGIRFLYNIYEIKPYAAGRTDLLIPYIQIKYLLRPNTVVTQYIK